MPKIPQYLSDTQAGGGVPSRRAGAEAFGAIQGNALQQQGRVIQAGGERIQQTADTVKQYADVKQKIYEAEESARIMNQLETLASEQQARAESPDADVYNFKDSETGLFDKQAEELTKGVKFKNPESRLRLDGAIADIKRRVTANAYQYESQAIKQRRDMVVQQSLTNTVQGIVNGSQGFDQAINSVNSIMEGFRGSYSVPEFEEAKQKNLSTMAQLSISEIAQTNPYAAKNLLGSDKASELLDANQVVRLNDEINGLIERQRREAIEQQQKMEKLAYTDPAKLTEMLGATSSEQSIQMQRKLGIRDGNLSLIPKDKASAFVNDLNGITNTDELINSLGAISQKYPGDYYSIAMRDLKKGGLSDQIAFISMMNPNEDKYVIDASFAMAKEGKDWKEVAKARGVKTADIETAVEDKIGELRELYFAEGGDVASLNSKTNELAMYFSAQGLDAEAATNLATDWLSKKTPMVTVNGKNTRLPSNNAYVPDDIESGLEMALESLKPDQVADIPGQNFYTDNIKRTSRFVLEPDEQYYALKSSINQYVLDKNGEVIRFPIMSILEAKAKKDEQTKQRLMQEQLKEVDIGD